MGSAGGKHPGSVAAAAAACTETTRPTGRTRLSAAGSRAPNPRSTISRKRKETVEDIRDETGPREVPIPATTGRSEGAGDTKESLGGRRQGGAGDPGGVSRTLTRDAGQPRERRRRGGPGSSSASGRAVPAPLRGTGGLWIQPGRGSSVLAGPIDPAPQSSDGTARRDSPTAWPTSRR